MEITSPKESILPSIKQTMEDKISPSGLPGWLLAIIALSILGGTSYFIYLKQTKKSRKRKKK